MSGSNPLRDCLPIFVCGLLALATTAFAQATNLRVEVVAGARPIAGASVTAGTLSATTDAAGIASIIVQPGNIDLLVTARGYLPHSESINVPADEARVIRIELLEPPDVDESITVSATRTGGRIDDQPLRVEVLDREEIEEKLLMTPGDIVMMLNEMGGMRVQTTSPSLGAASVRVQGMRGRYTRFLADGLPLFGEVGGLGLLQIPPMDLAQVEVIKGVASSLYGAGAMGGVVNLISRSPGADATREVLLNRSTRGATDVVGFASAPLSSSWGLTLLGGGHFQRQTDVNHEHWSDLPGYRRVVARPRVFWNDSQGNRFFATAGVTMENRHGGTHDDEDLPVAGRPFVESLDTRAVDFGFLDQRIINGRYIVTTRGSWSQKRHGHLFGDVVEHDRHDSGFGEVTLRGTAGDHTWVTGVAFERDTYQAREVPRFNYAFSVPGLFVQDDVRITDWMAVSASARYDHHDVYGSFVSPRISALLRSGGWNSRISFGTGFVGPSALTEETEAAGLTRLAIPATLRAERGRSGSIDLTRTAGALSTTVTVFTSRVSDSITVERDRSYAIRNAGPTTTRGIETLATLRHEPFALTASYTYVHARELDRGVRREVPLTPRHSAGVVGMWEREDQGRLGLEFYYTGRQELEANPYAAHSRPYLIVGALVERRVGRMRWFVNAENLGGVQQSNWDPIVRPVRGVDGRWTVDAWAPLEGRNINGGVRFSF